MLPNTPGATNPQGTVSKSCRLSSESFDEFVCNEEYMPNDLHVDHNNVSFCDIFSMAQHVISCLSGCETNTELVLRYPHGTARLHPFIFHVKKLDSYKKSRHNLAFIVLQTSCVLCFFSRSFSLLTPIKNQFFRCFGLKIDHWNPGRGSGDLYIRNDLTK